MKTMNSRLFPTMEDLQVLFTQGYATNAGIAIRDTAKDDWFNNFTIPVYYVKCEIDDFIQMGDHERKAHLTSKISIPIPYMGMLKGYQNQLAMIGIDYGVTSDPDDIDKDGDCKLYILIFDDTWNETYGDDDEDFSFPLCDGDEVFINLNGSNAEWAFEVYHPIRYKRYLDRKSMSNFCCYDGTIKVIGICLTPYLNAFPYIHLIVQGNDNLNNDGEEEARQERIIGAIEKQKAEISSTTPISYELTIDGPAKALSEVDDPYLKMMLGHNAVALMVDPREIDTSGPCPRVHLYFNISEETGGIIISSSKMSLDFVKKSEKPE